MKAILNQTIPYDPFSPRPLPGIRPLPIEDWLQVNDAYAGQMAERARLVETARDQVLWLDPAAFDAAVELLETVLSALPAGFEWQGAEVLCPDGRRVPPDFARPLESLSQLAAEDFCLLRKEGDEHVLRGALLCFPASWSLAEKAGRPLIGIHEPVDSYDAGIAKRVQRLFDGVRPGRPLWRFNALWYDDPSLHQPRGEAERRVPVGSEHAPYFRSERQCVLRLPRTNAVVFSILTYVLSRETALSAGPGSA